MTAIPATLGVDLNPVAATSMAFDVVCVTNTYDRKERLASRVFGRSIEGVSWDTANDICEEMQAHNTNAAYVFTSYYVVDAGRRFAVDTTLRAERDLPPFGLRREGWSMRDGKPQIKCGNCGTWGDHDTDCCVLPELPF